jgi:hypothetical protein
MKFTWRKIIVDADDYMDAAAKLWAFDYRVNVDDGMYYMSEEQVDYQIIVFRDEPNNYYIRDSKTFDKVLIDTYTRTSCIGSYTSLTKAKKTVEMLTAMGGGRNNGIA